MVDFGSEVWTALKAQGKSLRGAAKELHYDVAYLSRVLNGKQAPSPELIQAVNEFLGLSLELEDAAPHDDEMDAWELARRVQASGVGKATHERLERASDGLAMAYPKAKPEDLLRQVRKHSAYVGKLLDGKKTLSEHRRLLVVGGWLSLLGATVHIDLMQDDAATARLGRQQQRLQGKPGILRLRHGASRLRLGDCSPMGITSRLLTSPVRLRG
ncbi:MULTISPECIES: helix-turn-helix transcriptional regulator [unclassified Streptomyces]|uniref:helix-turn-helix domain-containing protein n=1 Tax=unclassified Streptomyces TaxID=2593676 RepID=UPI00344CE234